MPTRAAWPFSTASSSKPHSSLPMLSSCQSDRLSKTASPLPGFCLGECGEWGNVFGGRAAYLKLPSLCPMPAMEPVDAADARPRIPLSDWVQDVSWWCLAPSHRRLPLWRVAIAVSQRLADAWFLVQLRTADERIKELEAKVRYHDDRADRAERWVYKRWVEIEQKFFGGDAVRFVERFEPRRASASKEQLLGEHPP